jgi:hypothetical protein
MQDQALNRVRPAFATLPGVSAPPPFGGSSRGIIVNVNPERMRAYGLSPDDIVQALAKGNPISPSGNMNLGDKYPIVPTNAIVKNPKDLEAVPLRRGANRRGLRARCRHRGRRRRCDHLLRPRQRPAHRLSPRHETRRRLHARSRQPRQKEHPRVPKAAARRHQGQLRVFDQSPVVNRSIKDLLKEGGLGAILTGLMVLLFLRDWRSAFIVVINIPLSLLAASFRPVDHRPEHPPDDARRPRARRRHPRR